MDHDVLIRIDENLKNLIESHKAHLEKYDNHVNENVVQFKNTNDEILILKKFFWMLLGAFTLFEIATRFIK